MNYSSFCDTLKQQLLNTLDEETTVSIRNIPKNNGVSFDALCILKPGERYSPAIYLNSLYEEYQRGYSLSEILSQIISSLEKQLPLSPNLIDSIQNFDSIKTRIAFRLISQDSNAELLEDLPWVPYLDLAVVFCIFLGLGESGQMSTLVHESQRNQWGLTVKDLYQLSLRNTPTLFPASIRSIEDVILDLPELDAAAKEKISSVPLDCRPDYSVLTNRNGIYGASCMLYDGVLKNFAEQMEADLIVLPSSIHEVLLLPDSGDLSYEFMSSMVRRINAEDVAPEERLSDHIYCFSRADGILSLCETESGSHDTPVPAEI